MRVSGIYVVVITIQVNITTLCGVCLLFIFANPCNALFWSAKLVKIRAAAYKQWLKAERVAVIAIRFITLAAAGIRRYPVQSFEYDGF